MNELVAGAIREIIREEEKKYSKIYWKAPLVGYARARDPLFGHIKEWVSEKHLLPQDLLPDAASAIVFFLPFADEIVASNKGGRHASYEWGDTYIKTNQAIATVNDVLAEVLIAHGYQCETTPATHNFNEKELISNWSHRHLGYIAGLGTFGLNNMLITEQGCCGRFGSCVTNYAFEPTPRPEYESCLYKAKGSCGLCVKRCVNQSLTEEAYDRFTCYDMCRENDAHLEELGLTDVCGKCLVGLPCSQRNPVKRAT